MQPSLQLPVLPHHWAALAACQGGAATPTGSACLPDSMPFAVVKSPLAKFDNVSATHPEPSTDSHGTALGGPDGEEVASLLRQLPPLHPQQPLQLSLQQQQLSLQQQQQHPPAPPCALAAAVPTAQPPAWLMGLFSTDLFSPCPRHPTLRKNECNQYCLTCSGGAPRGMCKYCLAEHAACGGRTWQIRKYMYQTCIHVEDIQPHFDVSGVQAYCINSKRAVLIHPKQMAPGMACPAFDNSCGGCAKPLRNDCTYCSLRCKVDVQFGLQPSTPTSASVAYLARGPAAQPAAARKQAAQQQAQQRHVVSASAAAAVLLTDGPPPKRVAALRALLPSTRRLVSAESDLSAHSSGSYCSTGSRKRRKGDRPQRSFLV
eukprot:scaffold4.g4681.t1